MGNDYLAVFLYRWDDANEHRDASTVSFGEARDVKQHYPSTVIGVATRPVGDPIEHHSTAPEFEDDEWNTFYDHVEDHSDDTRWFATPLECDPDAE